jgi:hypothetical protein
MMKILMQLQQVQILMDNNIMHLTYFVIQLNGVIMVGLITYYLKVIGLVVILLQAIEELWIGGIKY